MLIRFHESLGFPWVSAGYKIPQPVAVCGDLCHRDPAPKETFNRWQLAVDSSMLAAGMLAGWLLAAGQEEGGGLQGCVARSSLEELGGLLTTYHLQVLILYYLSLMSYLLLYIT